MEKITFTDPETNEKVDFVVELETQLNGVRYLLVSDDEETEEADAYILKEIENGDDEIVYQMVEDDIEFSSLAKVFSELADEETNILF